MKRTVVGEHEVCELCGKKAELRPYGPICGLLNNTDALVVGGDEARYGG